MSHRRRRGEMALALFFAVILTLGGGGALYFASTMTVHSDSGAVPSTPGVHAERYARAIEAPSSRIAPTSPG